MQVMPTIEEVIQGELLGSLSLETKQQIVREAVANVMREGKATPSQLRQICQRQLLKRVEQIFEEEMSSEAVTTRLREFIAETIMKILSEPDFVKKIRTATFESFKNAAGRLLNGY